MKSKKRLALLLALTMILGAALPARAARFGIRVLLDGELLTEEAYVDANYRTQAPVEIAQRLGVEVSLNTGDAAGDTTVVEGYLPLRYVAEASGYSVAWSAGTVYLTSPGRTQAVTNLPRVDMDRWLYNAEDNVYYQIGIAYCETPADESYENLAIFVPGAYLTGTANEDGTFSCVVNESAAVNGYTAATAPIVLPVETPGYSAMAPLTAYTSLTDYMEAGFVYVHAGCRGRDAGAPAGVTDLKAAIRYIRWNDQLPGNADAIFTFGMSGGGAQSGLVGVTGDSDLYAPYLTAIGAVEGVSDAVLGSMCWCPITSLDSADGAYEWMMGATRTGLSDQEQAISDALAESFAAYINGIDITDTQGNALTLTESGDGIYQAGSYYDYILSEVERSLNNFLSDTTFPYDASASTSGGMGHGDRGFGGGELPEGFTPPDGAAFGGFGGRGQQAGGDTAYEDMDNISRSSSGSTSRIDLSGTYETAQDYVDAMNANGTWVTYDAETNTAKITSLADFVKAFKPTSKSLGAFDQLDGGQGENTLFGYGDGSGAHFDADLAAILADLGSQYADAYATDLQRADAQGETVDYRLHMYSPLYYLLPSSEGYGTSTVAKYFRIRTGVAQSDTAVTTEVNLALALENYRGVEDVDFEMVWGQQHVKAERTGDSDTNFIAWVNSCLAGETQPTEQGGPNGNGGPGGMGGPGGNGGFGGGPGGGGNGGGFGAPDKSTDAELQTLITEVADDFIQADYTDADTGLTVTYNLYLPQGYNEAGSYPMVVFIADSSLAGKDAVASLTQGYGALVWAEDSWQTDHPSIVLVPAYPETILDDHNGYSTTEYVELTKRLIENISAQYAVDTTKIYGTGQSMGCMTTLILASKYPDLYASCMFVDGQWDVSTLSSLGGQRFVYFAAEGDSSAYAGAQELLAAFDQAGVTYATATWDATWTQEELTAAAEALFAQGEQRNVIFWLKGTVLPEGTPEGTSEHMYSFDFAYKANAVREWLLGQDGD